MIYLNTSQVIDYNYQLQISASKEASPQVSDKELLTSTLERIEYSIVFGQDQFPTLATKAAHLWYMLSRFQVFNNGNKRTSIISMLTMLELNYQGFIYNQVTVNDIYHLTKDISVNKCEEDKLRDFVSSSIHHKDSKISPDMAVEHFMKQPALAKVINKLAQE